MKCQNKCSKLYNTLATHPILTLILIGLLIRIPISILFTHSYDVKYWGTILENLESGNELYNLPGYYYTPVWGYFIAVIGFIATSLFNMGTLGIQNDAFVFAPATDWGYYADLVADPWYSFIYKMFFTLCDVLIALLLYNIVLEYTSEKRKAVIAFAMWWLCPLMIYTANVHAMFDSLPILMTVLSFYLLLKEQHLFAGISFGLAVMCKLFPAYLMFIFIAYIISKNRGNRTKCLMEIGLAVFGAAVVSIIVLLPDIINGDLSQAFGVVSNRVSEIGDSGEKAAWDNLVSSGYLIVILLQPLIFALELVMSWKMARTEENREKRMFYLTMLSATCIFLWTPTPTYLMLILPFITIHALVNDWEYRKAYWFITISAVCYAIYMHNFSDLIQASTYFHLISADTVKAGIEFMDSELFTGMTIQSLGNFILGALETLAIYSVFLIIILRYLKKRRREHTA